MDHKHNALNYHGMTSVSWKKKEATMTENDGAGFVRPRGSDEGKGGGVASATTTRSGGRECPAPTTRASVLHPGSVLKELEIP